MIAVCDALYRLATQTDGQRCIPEYWADQQLLGLAAVNDHADISRLSNELVDK